MKTKVFKLLSILLTLAILATTCICVIGTASAVEGEQAPDEIVYPENSYFISSKGREVPTGKRPEGLGTIDNPVKYFADVTRLIKADGYGADDTVYVFVKSGETVKWTATQDFGNGVESTIDAKKPVAYDCKVVLDSTIPGDNATVSHYDFLDLVSDITFKSINLVVKYMYGCFRLNHYNVVFEEGSYVEVPEFFIGGKSGVKYNDEFTLEINGAFKTNKFFIMSNYGSGTYEKDVNIIINNENAAVPIYLTGYRPDNKFTYNGNINITVNKAKTISLADHQGVSTFNGALNLIVDSSVKIPQSVTTNFEAAKFAKGKWLITRITAENDFIQLSNEAGKFNVKNGAKAYVRQLGGKLITETDGVIDLSKKSGAYTISDKPIDEILDDSHKMLYFKGMGGTNYIYSRAPITPGKTYRLEYSIYTASFDDSLPTCRYNGDRKAVGDDMVIISSTEVDNYYKVVAEITIPENYSAVDKDNLPFFGVCLPASATGVIFDWIVYDVEDKAKTNILRNSNFHAGLDQIALNFDFWGAIYTDDRGGAGLLEWTNGVAELAVKTYDPKFIDELIYAENPNDGEWWKPGDIIEETFDSYAKVVGTFEDQDGNPIKNVKMLLVSDEHTYDVKTNSKGAFNFDRIVTGNYELFFVDGKEKIESGFSEFIGPDELVTFRVVSDISALLQAQQDTTTDFETETPEEEVEEYIPTGGFAATVYTPLLETVPNLKVILSGIGEVVTDANGSFAFANIPVGTYDLYTVLEDGTKYIFRQVAIEENRDINAKLKYDVAVDEVEGPSNNGWIIWVIVASVAALLIVGGLVFFLIFKKKKA